MKPELALRLRRIARLPLVSPRQWMRRLVCRRPIYSALARRFLEAQERQG